MASYEQSASPIQAAMHRQAEALFKDRNFRPRNELARVRNKLEALYQNPPMTKKDEDQRDLRTAWLVVRAGIIATTATMQDLQQSPASALETARSRKPERHRAPTLAQAAMELTGQIRNFSPASETKELALLKMVALADTVLRSQNPAISHGLVHSNWSQVAGRPADSAFRIPPVTIKSEEEIFGPSLAQPRRAQVLDLSQLPPGSRYAGSTPRPVN